MSASHVPATVTTTSASPPASARRGERRGRDRAGPWYNARVRRFGRHALNALTVLSLLMCAATCALWLRGERMSDSFALRDLAWEKGSPMAGLVARCWYIDGHRGGFSIARG